MQYVKMAIYNVMKQAILSTYTVYTQHELRKHIENYVKIIGQGRVGLAH